MQFATRVEESQAERFRRTTAALGTTPSDALRMFVASFNACGGFPYDVRVEEPNEASLEAISQAREMISSGDRGYATADALIAALESQDR